MARNRIYVAVVGIVLSLFFLTGLSEAVSDAQTAGEMVSIEILGYGLFSVEEPGALPAHDTTRDKLAVDGDASALTLIKKTDRIPAVLGKAFGVRYVVRGTPKGRSVPIEVKVVTPGLVAPHSGVVSREEKWTMSKVIGEITYDVFVFEKEWELVPGQWTIQLFSGKRKLAEKTYDVYAEEEEIPAHIPERVRAEIERLSSPDLVIRRNAICLLAEMGRDAVPAIPYLMRNLDHLRSLRHGLQEIAEASSDVLAALGEPSIKPLIEALGEVDANLWYGGDVTLGWPGRTLAMIGEPAIEPLCRALAEHPEMKVRLGAASVLGKVRCKTGGAPLPEGKEKRPAGPVRASAPEIITGEPQCGRVLQSLTAAVKKSDENYWVRGKAFASIVGFGEGQISEDVLQLADWEENIDVRKYCLSICAKVRDPRLAGYWIEQLTDWDPYIRTTSAQALAETPSDRAVEPLIRAWKDPAPIVRTAVAKALGATGDPRAVAPLIMLLGDKERDVRRAAAEALGRLKDPLAVGPLLGLLGDPDRSHPNMNVRTGAIWALGELRAPEAVDPLLGMLKDKDLRQPATQALGKIGSKRAVASLLELLRDESSYVRRAAIEALGEIKGVEAVPTLIEVVQDANFHFREGSEVCASLAKIGAPAVKPLIETLRRGGASYEPLQRIVGVLATIGTPAVEPLIQALKDESRPVREGAAAALGKIKDPRAVVPLTQTLRDPYIDHESARSLGLIGEPSVEPLLRMMGESNSEARSRVIDALGETRNRRATGALVSALEDNSPHIRTAAAQALWKIRDEQAVEPLIRRLQDKDNQVRTWATAALGETKDKRAVDPLIALLESDPPSRSHTIGALGRLGDRRAIRHISVYLQDEDQQLRSRAATALGEIGDESAVEPLLQTLLDKNRDVKFCGWESLRKITGKDFGDNPGEWRRWLALKKICRGQQRTGLKK